jgi:hypothetical protein
MRRHRELRREKSNIAERPDQRLEGHECVHVSACLTHREKLAGGFGGGDKQETFPDRRGRRLLAQDGQSAEQSLHRYRQMSFGHRGIDDCLRFRRGCNRCQALAHSHVVEPGFGPNRFCRSEIYINDPDQDGVTA